MNLMAILCLIGSSNAFFLSQTPRSFYKPTTSKRTSLSETTTTLTESLDTIFASLVKVNPSNDNEKLDLPTFLKWEEMEELLSQELLTLSDLETLYNKAISDSSSGLTLTEFKQLNDEIDNLTQEQKEFSRSPSPSPVPTNPSLASIFASLQTNSLVTFHQLSEWDEMRDLVATNLLSLTDLEKIFNDVIDSPSSEGLTLSAFMQLNDAIDNVLEFESESQSQAQSQAQSQSKQIASPLLQPLLSKIEKFAMSESSPACLTSDEFFDEDVLAMVDALEASTTLSENLQAQSIAGDWELIYTSSSLMKFHSGLTGLSSTFKGEFAQLKQSLNLNPYEQSVEYTEKIKTLLPKPLLASVKGNWTFKKTRSLISGANIYMLNVEPDTVKYLKTSTRADHWKSVRSANVSDLTFLSSEVRVMRGNTSRSTVFIWKRI